MNIALNILSTGRTWIVLPALVAAVCALPLLAAAESDSARSALFSLDPSPCVRGGSDGTESAPFNTCQLLGDVNCDCTVNILDLLAVRNKLRQDPGSAENCRADVTGDGTINILDLLAVRNRLRTSCPE